MTIDGQLDLHGKPVLRIEANVQGLGTMAIGELGDFDKMPRAGDIIECTVRYKVTSENYGSTYDKDGMEKTQFGVDLQLKPIKKGFTVTNHVTEAELDDAFYSRHQTA